VQTVKHRIPNPTAAHHFIPYGFALVVFFFGFTDLPRMREAAFPLFCLIILLLAVPVLVDFRRIRPRP
jgi:hypothetical protein